MSRAAGLGARVARSRRTLALARAMAQANAATSSALAVLRSALLAKPQLPSSRTRTPNPAV